MKRPSAVLVSVLLGLFALAGCSSAAADKSTRAPKANAADDDKKNDTDEDESDSTSSASRTTPTDTSTTTSPTEPAAPAAPQPAGFPRAAAGGECPLGDGVYCNGNGVDGAAATLYRCAGGMISVEKTCAMACLFMKNGTPDACDGDTTKCPRGSGLYCGGNYLSGDAKNLYRCTNGTVTVEQACVTSCVKEPDGTPDRCE